MAKNTIDLNLGPELHEMRLMGESIELKIVTHVKPLLEALKEFGAWSEKLQKMKEDIPPRLYEMEKDEYGNVRTGPKTARQPLLGNNGAQAQKLRTPQINERQA